MNPKTDSIKLSDCATTLEEARGVIDRQEALIEQLRFNKARLIAELAELRKDMVRLRLTAAIDAAMEGEK
jgi:hypothetical protein